jgi:glycosyltransferase involved in cell wall biosynthesis
MHILHITPYYVPAFAFGGVVAAVANLNQALIAYGQHRITVVTTDALTQTERYTGTEIDNLTPRPPLHLERGSRALGDGGEVKNVRVVRARNLSVGLRGKMNLSTPLGLPRLLKPLLSDVDVIHLHEFRTLENLLALRVIPPHIPVVLSPHGTLGYATGRGGLKQYWDRWLSPAVARHINHVIALTEYEKSEVKALWQEFGLTPRISVIPNGIALESVQLAGGGDFRQRHGIADKAPLVLFMGRLHARKGVEPLVRAFKLANVPDARLILAGPDEGMLAVLTPLLDERIRVVGYLDGAAKLAALDAADIFALPATGEGLSMALLEALGAGLPVIISPGCNMPEVAEAGAGLIVEPQVESLAAALRALLTDEAQRSPMGQAAQQLVTTRFAWEGIIPRMEAVYRSVMKPTL